MLNPKGKPQIWPWIRAGLPVEHHTTGRRTAPFWPLPRDFRTDLRKRIALRMKLYRPWCGCQCSVNVAVSVERGARHCPAPGRTIGRVQEAAQIADLSWWMISAPGAVAARTSNTAEAAHVLPRSTRLRVPQWSDQRRQQRVRLASGVHAPSASVADDGPMIRACWRERSWR